MNRLGTEKNSYKYFVDMILSASEYEWVRKEGLNMTSYARRIEGGKRIVRHEARRVYGCQVMMLVAVDLALMVRLAVIWVW